jgi:hypothetical protein
MKLKEEVKVVRAKVVEQVRTRDLLERRIYGLCNDLSDYNLQNEFFARFYLKAFPEKLSAYIEYGGFDDCYCSEWITRFLKGTPSVYMDGNTLRAYLQTCIDWNASKLRVVRDE